MGIKPGHSWVKRRRSVDLSKGKQEASNQERQRVLIKKFLGRKDRLQNGPECACKRSPVVLDIHRKTLSKAPCRVHREREGGGTAIYRRRHDRMRKRICELDGPKRSVRKQDCACTAVQNARSTGN